MDRIEEMMASKAWPYEQARRVIEHRRGRMLNPTVLFETGFGPSGLPHIGTFAEVARTAMVERAYQHLTGEPTKLVVFSDDLDALRSVPDNVPNQQMLRDHLGVSLSRVPDPFEKYESFAAHNNAMLREFLDSFGFVYEFRSAAEQYRSNISFEGGMRVFHEFHDMIRDIIAPTLGADRAAHYSPFLPIDPETGRVFEARIIYNDVQRERFNYVNPVTGKGAWSSILHGACKLQWKADWAMRWFVQEVDFEMAGKDLTDSVKLSSEILEAIGWKPPVTMIYEMFLDADGHKISKSKGNGLTIEDWLHYGSRKSLEYYLYQSPGKAKTLHPGVIPRVMDDYNEALRRYPDQELREQLGNGVHHIHTNVPSPCPVSFALLLNIATTIVPKDPAALWTYVERYASAGAYWPDLNELVTNVYNYYWDVKSKELSVRAPTVEEKIAIRDLLDRFDRLDPFSTDEQIQFEVYEAGKAHYGKERLRDWFAMLYEVLLGQSSGPRFGAFAHLYGLEATRGLLRGVLGVEPYSAA